jgi:hypothetical protein
LFGVEYYRLTMESPSQGVSNWSYRRKSIGRIAAVCMVLVAVLYACLLALEWNRRQIVHKLSTDVERLRVSQTTEAEIQRLAQKYGGEYSGPKNGADSSQPANYVVSVWNPGFYIGGVKRAFPGRRLWGAVAYLPVENGMLSEVHFGIGVHRADELALDASVVMTGRKPLAAPEGLSYFVHQAHVTGPPTESLIVELSSAATPEERRKGFDFNLACLTGFRECKHVCEVMPTAWKDLPLERRIQYGDGQEKVTDPECQARTR